MKDLFSISVFLFLVCACQRESIKTIDVDPEFEPYVNSFVEEATKRGVDVNFEESGLSIQFGEAGKNVNGICRGFRANMSSAHEIIIDRNRWRDDNEFEKERLIYHELGHCQLFRPHTIDTLANGEWKSIMRDGSPPQGYGFRAFNMTGIRRDYYLDELFNQAIAAPEWANITAAYNDILEDQKELLLEVNDRMNFFRSTDLSGNFEIEMEFIFTNEFINNALGFYWGGFGEMQSMGMTLSALNLFIVNRLENYGILRAFESFDGLRLNESVKMTVRKIDDKYYYFVNEGFIYWSDFEPLQSNVVEIVQNAAFNYPVERFTVKKIKN